MSVMDGPNLPAPAWDLPPLPTVEECREFLRLVNAGRVAGGLDALDVLDFDGAAPCHGLNCLSARNLFMPTGATSVGSDYARGASDSVMAAIGSVEFGEGVQLPVIPDAILKVTDPFDAETPGLRARLVEAGVVAPLAIMAGATLEPTGDPVRDFANAITAAEQDA